MRIDPAAQQKFQKQSGETGKATSTTTTYYGSKLQTAYSGRVVSRQTTSGLLGNAATHIDASRLSNLKEDFGFLAQSGVATSKAKQLVGSGASIGKRAHGLSDLFGSNGTRDRAGQLLGPVGGGLAGLRNQHLSDETGQAPTEPSTWQKTKEFVKTWFTEAMMQWGGKASPIPLPPAPPDAETGKDMHKGVTFFKDLLFPGGLGNYYEQRGGIEPQPPAPTNPDQIPNPEADSGRTRHIVAENIRGIAARLSANVTPNPEANPASFGPVNFGATTLGANAQLAEFVNDPEALTRLTPEQTKELEARLSKYILRAKEL